jgi:hypothetical protein
VYEDSDGKFIPIAELIYLTEFAGPILNYHYYNARGSFLGINRLDFSSGWPVVV